MGRVERRDPIQGDRQIGDQSGTGRRSPPNGSSTPPAHDRPPHRDAFKAEVEHMANVRYGEI